MSQPIKRTLTLDNAATPYECCGLFDICTDADLLSLSYQGVDPFLDWLTWQANKFCYIRKSFITYIGPERVGGRSGEHCTDGHLANPCADAYGFEAGKCDFVLHDFARFRRKGPTRDITTNNEMYCAMQPRYRLDGSVITDSKELDMVMATEALLQDLRKHVIWGNGGAAGSMDGLQQLLDSTYTDPEGNRCKMMDSNVILWNGNPMTGGAGETWNGNPIGATYDLVDVLLALYRRIRQRLSWSPTLAGNLVPGNIVLVMPTFLVQCLLDFYTCWSVCPSNAYIDTIEARLFRNSLNGGMFGAGAITLDGFTIPIIAYDWGTIVGPTRGDIYMLTGQVGSTRLLEGQYLDMRAVPTDLPGQSFNVTDGGRILTWTNRQQTCYEQVIEMRPRLLCWAPWAQGVIYNVGCGGPAGPLSPDPCDTSWFPGGSVTPASCPPSDGQFV
jgi:hypothetical protein